MIQSCIISWGSWRNEYKFTLFVCLCMFGLSIEPNVSKVILAYRKWQVAVENQPYSHWNP